MNLDAICEDSESQFPNYTLQKTSRWVGAHDSLHPITLSSLVRPPGLIADTHTAMRRARAVMHSQHPWPIRKDLSTVTVSR